jgi:hypothetical protein
MAQGICRREVSSWSISIIFLRGHFLLDRFAGSILQRSCDAGLKVDPDVDLRSELHRSIMTLA